MRYVPLHLHSEYSLLDGAIRQKELINFAKENNFDAVAVTDHGVMYGAIELYRLAKDAQFKIILGCEFYVYHGDITKKTLQTESYFTLYCLQKTIPDIKIL